MKKALLPQLTAPIERTTLPARSQRNIQCDDGGVYASMVARQCERKCGGFSGDDRTNCFGSCSGMAGSMCDRVIIHNLSIHAIKQCLAHAGDDAE